MAKKPSKYKNKKVIYNGIKFDSVGEMRRYIDLKVYEAAGVIKNLRIQVPFVLVPSAVINGRKVPAMKYKADFVYEQDGRQVVEDFKGFRDRIYRMKRHMMKAFLNIDILET